MTPMEFDHYCEGWRRANVPGANIDPLEPHEWKRLQAQFPKRILADGTRVH